MSRHRFDSDSKFTKLDAVWLPAKFGDQIWMVARPTRIVGFEFRGGLLGGATIGSVRFANLEQLAGDSLNVPLAMLDNERQVYPTLRPNERLQVTITASARDAVEFRPVGLQLEV